MRGLVIRTEKHFLPSNEESWVAWDPSVPEVYGMGADEDAAKDDLERALELWNSQGARGSLSETESGACSVDSSIKIVDPTASEDWRAKVPA